MEAKFLVVAFVLMSVLAGCAGKNTKPKQAAQTENAKVVKTEKAPENTVTDKKLDVVNGNVWSSQMQDQYAVLTSTNVAGSVSVVKTFDNQIKIQIPSDISFSINRADVKPDFKKLLNVIVSVLVNNPRSIATVIGHTDNTGSDAVNDPLSVARATSVKDYLTEGGVDSARVSKDGRGSREPIVTNDTSANRAKNRRVEIFIRQPA